MHVSYELEQVVETVTDLEVERQLNRSAQDITAMMEDVQSIEKLRTEFQSELAEVQLVFKRLISFIKQNSIVPYNDSTPKYIDEVLMPKIIHESGRLAALREDRERYDEVVKIFEDGTNSMLENDMISREEIGKQIKTLCSMKHFGQQIQKVWDDVKNMYDGQFREETPYEVQI
jgi:hypothetical protein